ncbi:hypothetical protein HK405_002535, partial [Cladochytrium tenue]
APAAYEGSDTSLSSDAGSLKGTEKFERSQRKRRRRRRAQGSEAVLAEPTLSAASVDPDAVAGDDAGCGTTGDDAPRRRRGGRSRSRRRRSRRRDDHPHSRFTLAPKGLLDRLFFGWAARLAVLVTAADDVLDIHLHLKSSESAKVTGDRLERMMADEMARAKRGGASGAGGDGGRGGGAPDPGREQTEETAATAVASSRTPTLKGLLSSSNRPLLFRAIRRTFGPQFAKLLFWRLLWMLFIYFAAYFLLRWLVDFNQLRAAAATDAPPVGAAPPIGLPPAPWKGQVLALAMFLACVVATVCFHQLSILSTRIGVQ